MGIDNTDDFFKIARSNDEPSTNTALTIDSSGNIGIGDTDPSEAKLSIAGIASGDYGIKIDQDQNKPAIYIDCEASGENAIEMHGKDCLYAVVDVSGGRAGYFDRNLDEAGSSPLVTLRDNHTSNTQPALAIQQDGNAAHIEFSGVGTGGIKFKASATDSADANTLDDYEEGTWNPTWVTSGDASAVFTYQSDTGAYYTKIGRMVYISGSIRTDTITANTDSGYLSIGSLPFTTGARTDGDNADDVINCISGGNWDANNFPDIGQINRDSTTFALYYSTGSGASVTSSEFEDLHISGYCRTYFSGHYRV
jgi:hypothetical protein